MEELFSWIGIELFYNKESFFLNKIVFYKSDASFMGANWNGVKVRAEVKFIELKAKTLNYNNFKLSKYVVNVNGSFKGKNTYSAYQIIDLRTIK